MKLKSACVYTFLAFSTIINVAMVAGYLMEVAYRKDESERREPEPFTETININVGLDKSIDNISAQFAFDYDQRVDTDGVIINAIETKYYNEIFNMGGKSKEYSYTLLWYTNFYTDFFSDNDYTTGPLNRLCSKYGYLTNENFINYSNVDKETILVNKVIEHWKRYFVLVQNYDKTFEIYSIEIANVNTINTLNSTAYPVLKKEYKVNIT